MSHFVIGVDVGGQSIKLGIVDDVGTIHLRNQVAVDARQSAGEITDLLIGELERIQSKARSEDKAPAAMGVVMPGYMDRDRNRILLAANLPNLSGSNLLQDIKDAVDLPVVFDADCNAAAWGEYRFGAGRGIDRLIVATVGTGIGAGAIIDGEIVRMFYHVAGSLGHIIVDPQGQRCSCGARGCLETRASGSALEQLANEMGRQHPDSRLGQILRERGYISGVEIGTALRENDDMAVRVVNECGRWLGMGIASWSVIYKPESVLIGGGIASLGKPYFAAIRCGLADVGMPHLVKNIAIQPAALGSDAGIIGAAALAMQYVKAN